MTWRVCTFDLFPYHHLSWIIPVITCIAFLFFAIPAFQCSLTVTKGAGDEFKLYIGYWSREDYALAVENGPKDDGNYCVKWNKDSKEAFFDAPWRFGKAVSIIGFFTCIATAFLNLFLIYMRFPSTWYIPVAALHVFNSMMCFFLLIGLASEVCSSTSCTLGPAGYVGIIGAILWLVAAVLYWCVYRTEIELAREKSTRKLDVENPNVLALPPPPTNSWSPSPAWKKKKGVEKQLALMPPPEIGVDETDRDPSSGSGGDPPVSSKKKSSARPKSSTAPGKEEAPKSPRKHGSVKKKPTNAAGTGGKKAAKKPSAGGKKKKKSASTT